MNSIWLLFRSSQWAMLFAVIALAVPAEASQGEAESASVSAADERRLGSLPGWLEMSASALGEWSGVAAGGERRGDSWRSLLTLEVAADLGRAFDSPGAGTVFLQAQSIRAEAGGSIDAGDLQVYSNIETDESRDDIMELWYERRLVSGSVRLKLGKMDANSEYAYVEAAGDFTHSSAGFSPSVFLFPSYPDPATSVNLFMDAWAPWADSTAVLGYGLFDGALADDIRTGRRGPSTFLENDVSDAYFHVLQWEVRTEHRGGETSRLSVGGWNQTGDFERFDGSVEGGTAGLFMTYERAVPRETVEETYAHYFMQYGLSDDRVSEVGQHVALGVVVEGPLGERRADSAGLYASLVDLSDDPSAGFESNELAFDAYYRWNHSDTLWVQPEVQWILDPSGSEDISDALVLGLRVSAEF